MALNIKNQHTCKLVAELAEMAGESMTQAITVAVEERLEKLKGSRDQRNILEWIERIASESPGGSSDHSDLYDESGLPA